MSVALPLSSCINLIRRRVSNRICDREQFHAFTPRPSAYERACPAREETGLYVAAGAPESRTRLGYDGSGADTIEWGIGAGIGKYLLSTAAYPGGIRLVNISQFIILTFHCDKQVHLFGELCRCFGPFFAVLGGRRCSSTVFTEGATAF